MTTLRGSRPRRRPALVQAALGAAALLMAAVMTAMAVTLLGTAASAAAGLEGIAPWQWPLLPTPPVERGFEAPTDPWGPGHRGVDLSAQVGQVVLAVADGTVTFAGYVAGRGVVAVRHGAIRSTYQPLIPIVRAGEEVDAGAALGRLTVVGSHCLPAACLHLGAREGPDYLDPLSLLGRAEIRLKPLGHPSVEPTTPSTRPLRAGRWASPTSGGVRSGAWVGLTIGGSKPFRRDVRVDLRGGQ